MPHQRPLKRPSEKSLITDYIQSTQLADVFTVQDLSIAIKKANAKSNMPDEDIALYHAILIRETLKKRDAVLENIHDFARDLALKPHRQGTRQEQLDDYEEDVDLADLTPVTLDSMIQLLEESQSSLSGEIELIEGQVESLKKDLTKRLNKLKSIQIPSATVTKQSRDKVGLATRSLQSVISYDDE